jgi:hypothetical protein
MTTNPSDTTLPALIAEKGFTSKQLERFEDRYYLEPNTGCWIWVGGDKSGGYGRFWLAGCRTEMRAHRWSYLYHRGEIPEGKEIDHLCRIPCCVNPSHLEAVTHLENMRRGTAAEKSAEYQRGKTHCPQGHPYSGDNLALEPGRPGKPPSRRCRICRKAARQRFTDRNHRGPNRFLGGLAGCDDTNGYGGKQMAYKPITCEDCCSEIDMNDTDSYDMDDGFVLCVECACNQPDEVPLSARPGKDEDEDADQ